MEHLRRVHRGVGIIPEETSANSPDAAPSHLGEPVRKRRRNSNRDEPEEAEDDEEEVDVKDEDDPAFFKLTLPELRIEVKRLHEVIAEKDRVIAQKDRTLKRFYKLIPPGSMPTQLGA